MQLLVAAVVSTGAAVAATPLSHERLGVNFTGAPPNLATASAAGVGLARDQVFVTKTTHEWNHGLGEIVSALLAAGMRLTLLQEHDTVPWEAQTRFYQSWAGAQGPARARLAPLAPRGQVAG